jgi:O-antigen/teichoic acid export membrane protein
MPVTCDSEDRVSLEPKGLTRRDLLKNIIRFGSGEMLARICSVAVMMFLGHRYGVVVVGAYALAVSLSWYSQTIIDFGLKHIGVRLIAQYPQHAPQIVYRVQRRRFSMACIVMPIMVIYSVYARLSTRLMWFVILFSLTSTLYAASLDWVAWGKQHLQLVGGFRSLVPLSILLAVIVARGRSDTVLWFAAVGNLVGYILQAVAFWLWWRRQTARLSMGWQEQIVIPVTITDSLLWRSTFVMGIAWCAQIAFNSIDMLMLGIVSGPDQVGLYSSAYRILMQVLVTYYLAVLPLYPVLSRLGPELRNSVLTTRVLGTLVGVGVSLSIGVCLLRRELLLLVFGRPFVAAATLLLILAWAVPLDFVTSYLNNAYIAWGMERKLLKCILVGAGTNIALNMLLLRRYGAIAAAINTIIAYIVYLAGLLLMRRNMHDNTRNRSAAVTAKPTAI